MTGRSRIAALSAVIFCCACAGLSLEAGVNRTDSRAVQETDGVWQSDGFGYLMEIDRQSVDFFHITPDICIATQIEGLKLSDVFDVHRFSDADTMYMSSMTEPFEFKFERIASVPDICAEEKDGSIPGTAAALISFLSTHYVFFEQRDVDREKLFSDISQAASQHIDEHSFYSALTGLLSRTNDAHVELFGTFDGTEQNFDADRGLIRRAIELRADQRGTSETVEREAFLQDFWVEGIGVELLAGQSQIAANDRIRFGAISDSIGYFSVRSMGGFVSKDGTDGQTEQAVLTNVMDRAIAYFDDVGVRSVIVDVSINSGGYEYLSRYLAGRFYDARREAYRAYAGDAKSHLPQIFFIEPEGQSQFIGPVYLLTSSETVSAAETFVMAMRARDEVVHVGEATRGALSTKLAKLLPNGWELMLSNQIYLDHEGWLWEANAAPPHLPIRMFPDRDVSDEDLLHVDFSMKHRAAIAELVEYIENDPHEM